VKGPTPRDHPPNVQIMAHTATATADDAALDVTSIHEAHADFVWRSLQRLGVREADLADALQEVFVVVHRRLGSFDGTSRMTTWLFGICLRVASSWRRRAWRRHEQVGSEEQVHARRDSSPGPDEVAAVREARRVLDRILGRMDLDKRAVFAMFEIDGMGCEQIAAILDVPVGTVYSRLHAARKAFRDALARERRMSGGGDD
jgi:RNA polymerase sigma-70 factor (ECF subfamily)